MAAIDHSEKLTSSTGLPVDHIFKCIDSGRKWIYGGQPVYIFKDACRDWPKTAKIQMVVWAWT